MRFHTGEKACKCEVCGEGFIDRAKLWKHKKDNDHLPPDYVKLER